MIDQVTWRAKILSSEACDAFLKEMRAVAWTEAKIGDGGDNTVVNESIRASSIIWLERTHWLTSVLWQAINRVNEDVYGFELHDHEAVQVTKYEHGQHYQWHCDLLYPPPDAGDKPRSEWQIRKLSMSLQLMDPRAYVGGEVQTRDARGTSWGSMTRGEDWRAKGSVLVFPSTTQHCVSPVSSGARISAVLWTTGSVWR